MQDKDDPLGFHGRLGFGTRPAVVVVDMCKAYFTEGSPLFIDRRDVVIHARTLVSAAREHGHPVWWTRVEIPTGSRSVFRRKARGLDVLTTDHPLGVWVPGLEPQEREPVITKQGASAFFATHLADALRRQRVDTVLLAGVSTSGCVRASAVDACQHDFIPIVVEEACGDRDEAIQSRNLADLDAKYADVMDLATVMDELRRLARSG